MSTVRVFAKPALAVEQQIAHLKSRGLAIADEVVAARNLRAIGFFRFCGYAQPWRHGHDGTKNPMFLPRTCFDDIVDVADFDRKLRTHLLEAIERIEVAIRAAFSNALGTNDGAHWFTDPSRFRVGHDHPRLIERIKHEIGFDFRNRLKRDEATRNYLSNYDLPELPPTWIIFEVLSLGTVSRIYKALDTNCQKKFAGEIGVNRDLLASWLEVVTVMRNFCAHHARIWNRHFPVKPQLPNNFHPYFRRTVINRRNEAVIEIGDFKLHTQVFVIVKLLELIGDRSQWVDRLFDLLETHPKLDRGAMGFPPDWMGYPTDAEMAALIEKEKAARRQLRAASKE
jgi:abortive infection bacteriophage resistance protein